MANNNCLFNAAYSGFIEGAIASRKISSSSASTYAGLKAAANVFATAVDGQVAADATISSSGAIVAPTTATIQGNELAKTGLMRAITAGVMMGSYTEDQTAGDYATLAAAVAALYTTALTNLLVP